MANQNHAGIHWIPRCKTSNHPRYAEMSFVDKVASIPLRTGADPVSPQARAHFFRKPYSYKKRVVTV